MAKLANYAAKKWHKTGGVLDISDPIRRDKLLRLVPVNEVWGIGRQTTKRLKLLGINTAYDLACQPVETIQVQFNVVVARTVLELKGEACIALEDVIPEKQQIVCSRSFKKRLIHYHELEEALTSFCSRAAEKLRQQQSVAGSITVFIRTNPNNSDEAQYQRSIHLLLNRASSDTRYLLNMAKQLLKDIFKIGYRYQKCGIQLGHIRLESIPSQIDLFDGADHFNTEQDNALMTVIDKINQRFPKSIAVNTVHIRNGWQQPVQYLSNHYTTDWNELAIVKC